MGALLYGLLASGEKQVGPELQNNRFSFILFLKVYILHNSPLNVKRESGDIVCCLEPSLLPGLG